MDDERKTKKQAAAILKIGVSTLGRWMREGKIKFEKVEAGKFESAVFFRSDDLAAFLPTITEPVTQPTAPAPKPTPAAVEPKDTRTWEQKFRDGDAPDSCGNHIDGYNPLYPQTGATLLGPAVRDDTPPAPKTGTSHMDPHLLSDHVDPNFPPLIPRNPQIGEGFTRSGSPLCAGYSQEKYDADMKAWRGGPSMSDQEIASRQAVSNITRSFPRH